MNEGSPSSQLPETLRGTPWRSHKAALPQMPPTMLSEGELRLLHWLTSTYYTGQGLIVDGGPFLGGSTTALAAGLVANPAAPAGRVIHSYDLFNTTTDFFDPTFSLYGLKPGESFLEIYKKNLAPYLDRLDIHEGDLMRHSWGGEKIEILFLDCAKTPELHDHAVRIWFPHLIPGRSILIQQDFGWWHYQWGNIMMEAFKDHFVILDDVPHATRAYLCVKEITPAKAASLTYCGMPGDERLRLMEEARKVPTNDEYAVRMRVNHAIEANQQKRPELLRDLLLGIFTAPRAELVTPVIVKLFPDQFTGPSEVPFPEQFNDPRLSLISQTSTQDRIALWGLIYAMQPKRVLEIGRARGGSTVLIASALRQVPGSVFVSMDPNVLDEHTIQPALEKSLQDRVTFIHGYSPAENQRASTAAGGKFDCVFIDANHFYEACLEDIRGILPYLAEDAVILLHDAFFAGVEDAVATAMNETPALVDCGLVSTLAYHGAASQTYRDRPQVFGGIRMLRYRTARATPPPDASRLRMHEEAARLASEPGVPRKRTFMEKLRRSFRKRLGMSPD